MLTTSFHQQNIRKQRHKGGDKRMKIECEVVEMLEGQPTMIKFKDIIYIQKPEIEVEQESESAVEQKTETVEHKPEYKPKQRHKPGFGDNYIFRRK